MKKRLLEDDPKPLLKSILAKGEKSSLKKTTINIHKKNVVFVDHLKPRIKKPVVEFIFNEEEEEMDK